MSYITVPVTDICKAMRLMDNGVQANGPVSFTLHNSDGFESKMQVDKDIALQWIVSNHSNTVSWDLVPGKTSRRLRCAKTNGGNWCVETMVLNRIN